MHRASSPPTVLSATLSISTPSERCPRIFTRRVGAQVVAGNFRSLPAASRVNGVENEPMASSSTTLFPPSIVSPSLPETLDPLKAIRITGIVTLTEGIRAYARLAVAIDDHRMRDGR